MNESYRNESHPVRPLRFLMSRSMASWPVIWNIRKPNIDSLMLCCDCGVCIAPKSAEFLSVCAQRHRTYDVYTTACIYMCVRLFQCARDTLSYHFVHVRYLVKPSPLILSWSDKNIFWYRYFIGILTYIF